MKIAVSAEGAGLEARTSTIFGRCPCMVFVDTDTWACESLPNAAQGASGGAGVQAAQGVVERGAQAVVTGNGPNAFKVLTRCPCAIRRRHGAHAVEAFREATRGMPRTVADHSGGGRYTSPRPDGRGEIKPARRAREAQATGGYHGPTPANTGRMRDAHRRFRGQQWAGQRLQPALWPLPVLRWPRSRARHRSPSLLEPLYPNSRQVPGCPLAGADVMLTGGMGGRAIMFFQQWYRPVTGTAGTVRHALEAIRQRCAAPIVPERGPWPRRRLTRGGQVEIGRLRGVEC